MYGPTVPSYVPVAPVTALPTLLPDVETDPIPPPPPPVVPKQKAQPTVSEVKVPPNEWTPVELPLHDLPEPPISIDKVTVKSTGSSTAAKIKNIRVDKCEGASDEFEDQVEKAVQQQLFESPTLSALLPYCGGSGGKNPYYNKIVSFDQLDFNTAKDGVGPMTFHFIVIDYGCSACLGDTLQDLIEDLRDDFDPDTRYISFDIVDISADGSTELSSTPAMLNNSIHVSYHHVPPTEDISLKMGGLFSIFIGTSPLVGSIGTKVYVYVNNDDIAQTLYDVEALSVKLKSMAQRFYESTNELLKDFVIKSYPHCFLSIGSGTITDSASWASWYPTPLDYGTIDHVFDDKLYCNETNTAAQQFSGNDQIEPIPDCGTTGPNPYAYTKIYWNHNNFSGPKIRIIIIDNGKINTCYGVSVLDTIHETAISTATIDIFDISESGSTELSGIPETIGDTTVSYTHVADVQDLVTQLKPLVASYSNNLHPSNDTGERKKDVYVRLHINNDETSKEFYGYALEIALIEIAEVWYNNITPNASKVSYNWLAFVVYPYCFTLKPYPRTRLPFYTIDNYAEQKNSITYISKYKNAKGEIFATNASWWSSGATFDTICVNRGDNSKEIGEHDQYSTLFGHKEYISSMLTNTCICEGEINELAPTDSLREKDIPPLPEPKIKKREYRQCEEMLNCPEELPDLSAECPLSPAPLEVQDIELELECPCDNTVAENTQVVDLLEGAVNPGKGTLTVTGVSSPGQGTATVSGKVATYVPPETAIEGNDSTFFEYNVKSSTGATATGTVTVTCVPATELTIEEKVLDFGCPCVDPKMLDLLEGVVDPCGGVLSVVETPISDPDKGSVLISGQNATYTPVFEGAGTTSFEYQVDSTSGATGVGTVTINCVKGVVEQDLVFLLDNSYSMIAPYIGSNVTRMDEAKRILTGFLNDVKLPPSYIGLKATPTTIAFDTELTTDKDLLLQRVADVTPTGGEAYEVDIEAAGLILEAGENNKQVLVCILDGGSNSTADAAIAAATAIKNREDKDVTIVVIGMLESVRGSNPLARILSDKLSLSADDSITYEELYTAIASPGQFYPAYGADLTAVYKSLLVSGGLNLPDFDHELANPCSGDNDPVDFEPISGLTDECGGALTLTSVEDPEYGSAVINGNVITYTPPAAGTMGSGSETSFEYTVTADDDTSATGTITISCVPVLKIADKDFTTTCPCEDQQIINLLTDIVDPDGGTLSVDTTPASEPATGSVTISENIATFTPAFDGVSTVSFGYTVSSSEGVTGVGTVNISCEKVDVGQDVVFYLDKAYTDPKYKAFPNYVLYHFLAEVVTPPSRFGLQSTTNQSTFDLGLVEGASGKTTVSNKLRDFSPTTSVNSASTLEEAASRFADSGERRKVIVCMLAGTSSFLKRWYKEGGSASETLSSIADVVDPIKASGIEIIVVSALTEEDAVRHRHYHLTYEDIYREIASPGQFYLARDIDKDVFYKSLLGADTLFAPDFEHELLNPCSDGNDPVDINPVLGLTDSCGGTYSVTSVVPPEYGSATVNSEGGITYTPPAQGTETYGSDNFEYIASTANSVLISGKVTVTCATDLELEPRTINILCPCGNSQGIDLIGGVVDPKGGTLSVSDTPATHPSIGTILISNNMATYMPDFDDEGSTFFEYTVTSTSGDTAVGKITINCVKRQASQDLVLVIDVSISIHNNDYAPGVTLLDALKNGMLGLLEEMDLQQSRIGTYTSDGNAGAGFDGKLDYLTDDKTFLKFIIEDTPAQNIPSYGSLFNNSNEILEAGSNQTKRMLCFLSKVTYRADVYIESIATLRDSGVEIIVIGLMPEEDLDWTPGGSQPTTEEMYIAIASPGKYYHISEILDLSEFLVGLLGTDEPCI